MVDVPWSQTKPNPLNITSCKVLQGFVQLWLKARSIRHLVRIEITGNNLVNYLTERYIMQAAPFTQLILVMSPFEKWVSLWCNG